MSASSRAAPVGRSRTAPFPGIIAHLAGPDPDGGHEKAFHIATVEQGMDASAYFEQAGFPALAERSGGLCSFWLGANLALYQSINDPLVNDSDLAPSINANADLFGSFMGALDIDDPTRAGRRAVVERVLGSAKFINAMEAEASQIIGEYLAKVEGRELPMDEFALNLTAYVDSLVPGVLDFRNVPLTDYLDSDQYGRIARSFFEIASEVISKLSPEAIKDADLIVDFTRDVLLSNFASIATAPSSNMIKGQFTQYGYAFSPEAIGRLSRSQLKELGTIIVATYDTTALSLLWSMAYIETTPRQRDRLIAALAGKEDASHVASALALEAVRLGGSNPTALWRQTKHPVTIRHSGIVVELPAGTMIWLDRRHANRDAHSFPCPHAFDARNIEQITRNAVGNTTSTLARNRYEINSFSMINADRNPRKCPGRLFAVRLQALALIEIYRRYDVVTSDIDTSLAKHSAMPRPRRPGTIILHAKAG
ncbi:cytochrome P450 [Sphingobium sp.]|uniref:cytochrome P450 n=1 Tax=Sphingobium sp. TaxID=1912891 RepID=UPI000DB5F763|nr:cytochrome P450 [Sphingobium sp.]PZU68640.1 MAG: cytochrome [Sphingobium sp.]